MELVLIVIILWLYLVRPWKDVETFGEMRYFLRPEHPYEFFRLKPQE